jgi:hypothetical protein
MIYIEFDETINDKDNVVRYKEVNETEWKYINIDANTLKLLIEKLGLSCVKITNKIYKGIVYQEESKEVSINHNGLKYTIN